MTTGLPHTTAPLHGVKEYATSRPRVLGWVRSAALLDGDWGTSIAYVLGIGFALSGYSSFWFLMLMLAFTALIAYNYTHICRLYPNGGGVYSSVYHRSKTFAVVGALLLAADYVITMALSVLDAFHYFDFAYPEIWAIGTIFALGALNWYGPRHSGGFALVISIATVSTILVIVIASAPTSLQSATVVKPIGGVFENWEHFVGIILSISGIEAISNMTGLMKDPQRDSRRAIYSVLTKVVVATVFLGLAMHAIPELTGHTEDMVRFLGEYYVGAWFGWIVAASLGMLLISAGNTALNDLISIQFLMSVDKELPAALRKLNNHGVPILPLVIATAAPCIVLLFVNDVLTLAQLYAIGVVGAILINVGSTSTDYSLPLRRWVRWMMFGSAILLFFVETSIAIDKPKAALFASIVLVLGLTARAIAKGARVPVAVPAEAQPIPVKPRRHVRRRPPSTRYMVSIKETSDRLLKFAIDEAKARNALLVVLRVKEISVGTLPGKLQLYGNGAEQHMEELCSEAGIEYEIITIPSYEVGYTIAEQAATFGVDRVILGATNRGVLENALKGSVIRSVSQLLPEEVQLVIFGG
ncbi:MAG TPA: universal stress protein [Bacteroidota bacterium]